EGSVFGQRICLAIRHAGRAARCPRRRGPRTRPADARSAAPGSARTLLPCRGTAPACGRGSRPPAPPLPLAPVGPGSRPRWSPPPSREGRAAGPPRPAAAASLQCRDPLPLLRPAQAIEAACLPAQVGQARGAEEAPLQPAAVAVREGAGRVVSLGPLRV